MESKESVWHRKAVDTNAESTLGDLHQLPILANFYLAGGTALALQLGHRRSADLDFFVGEDFDEDAIIQQLQHLEAFALVEKKPSTIHATIRGTKVSFIGYAYPVLFPFQLFLGVHVADPRDIGGMKISAIASRGTKRDFVDLYMVSQQYGLRQLLDWFKQKFAQVNYSLVHVLKSLTYFEEAEKEPMPDMFVPLPWDHVKQFFKKEAPRLL